MPRRSSVRRQRLQQTRVPASSQPQHGSASSDLHTDATDSDSDWLTWRWSSKRWCRRCNRQHAWCQCMDGIYILVCEDFETLYMLNKCLQHLIAW